jgi:hypothetical protein
MKLTVTSYEPGDVAVIHPEALAGDVESLLVSLGWANIGDDRFEIRAASQGKSSQ